MKYAFEVVFSLIFPLCLCLSVSHCHTRMRAHAHTHTMQHMILKLQIHPKDIVYFFGRAHFPTPPSLRKMISPDHASLELLRWLYQVYQILFLLPIVGPQMSSNPFHPFLGILRGYLSGLELALAVNKLLSNLQSCAEVPRHASCAHVRTPWDRCCPCGPFHPQRCECCLGSGWRPAHSKAASCLKSQ